MLVHPPLDTRKRLRGTVCFALVAVVGLTGVAACASGPPPVSSEAAAPDSDVPYGAGYDQLDQAQRRLLEDFARRYAEVTGESLAESFYDDMSVSERSTFEAVTHALLLSELTDHEGTPLGTALELVDTIETIRGHEPGVRGDYQFRIYCVLRRDAVDVLEKSEQFSRGMDNTHFHVEFPINYRQRGGAPSIQISIADDGVRADIDVDYRSSAFPVVLFDGHLTTANSDVRAGGNYLRHVGRWSGLRDWWRYLFGLSLAEDEEEEVARARNALSAVPPVPRLSADVPVEEGVADFLTAWFIERDVPEAMGYVSATAYPCVLELEDNAADSLMAPVRLIRNLTRVAEEVGLTTTLDHSVSSLPLPTSRLVARDHPMESIFEIVAVPEGVARSMLCRAPRAAEGDAGRDRHSQHFTASMRIQRLGDLEVDLMTLWAKEAGYWKIISFHVDVEPDIDALLHLDENGPWGTHAGGLPTAPADPEFERVAGQLLEDWFVERDYDATEQYFSPRCYPCVALYLHEDEGPPEGTRETRARFRDMLREIGETVEQADDLEDELRAAPPWNPELHLMEHARSEAYTLVTMPDHMAHAFDCGNRATGSFYVEPGAVETGRFRAQIFQLRRAGNHGPVLLLLWEQREDRWQVVSYDVLTS